MGAMDDVRRGAATIEAVAEAPSQFGHDEAYWVNGTEIAHIESESIVEVRLTRRVISEMRPMLKAHPAVHLRRGTSDWLEVDVASPEDAAFAVDLVRRAAAAHAHASVASNLPPSPREVARRRRLHGA